MLRLAQSGFVFPWDDREISSRISEVFQRREEEKSDRSEKQKALRKCFRCQPEISSDSSDCRGKSLSLALVCSRDCHWCHWITDRLIISLDLLLIIEFELVFLSSAHHLFNFLDMFPPRVFSFSWWSLIGILPVWSWSRSVGRTGPAPFSLLNTDRLH